MLIHEVGFHIQLVLDTLPADSEEVFKRLDSYYRITHVGAFLKPSECLSYLRPIG